MVHTPFSFSTRVSFIVLFFVSLPGIVFAENLSGRVLDPQENAVANATVQLFDRNTGEQRTTRSSKDGRYQFQGIPSGSYRIQAQASGGALKGSDEVSVQGDAVRDVSLKLGAVRDEIVVTASGAPLDATEVGKVVDVINANELDLRDTLEIGEAVRALPGLQVQTLEGPGSFTTINTRGMRAVDTAVLIDGMRFRDAGSPQNDVTAFLGTMTAVDLDRIEVMRGAGSSLYGSNATAGIINIASRTGGKPLHGDFRMEGGGLGMIRSIAGIAGGIGTRFGYSGGVSHLNVTQGVRDRNPYRNTSAQGSAKFSFTPGITLTGRIWGNKSYLTSTENVTFTPAILANSAPGFVRAIPLPDDQLELFEKKQPFAAGSATYIPNQIDPDGRLRSSFLTDSITLQHVLSPDTTYRVAYQGVDTWRGYIDGPAGPGAFEPLATRTSHFNGQTNTVQGRVDKRAGSHNFLSAGYEFERERYFSFNDTPTNSARTATIELQQYNHAVYGQDQIRLADGRVQLMLSGRAQFFSLQHPVFSGGASTPYQSAIGSIDTPNSFTGDAAAAYFFQKSQTKFRSHVGNSFRAPSSYERFGGSPTGTTLYGDPRLKPEHLIAFDGGVDQWLLHSRLQLSATMFYTELKEVIRFANSLPAGDPFGRFFGYQNGGGGIARGVELGVHASLTRSTRFEGTYTYTNSDSNTPTAGSNYYKVIDLSPHTFTFRVTQWAGPKFHTTFELFGRSDYVNTFFAADNRLFVFNGETKANMIAAYEFPSGDRRSLELYVKVENVFNQRAYEDGFIGPRAWAVGGFRVRY